MKAMVLSDLTGEGKSEAPAWCEEKHGDWATDCPLGLARQRARRSKCYSFGIPAGNGLLQDRC
jgi:hypothetical protein